MVAFLAARRGAGAGPRRRDPLTGRILATSPVLVQPVPICIRSRGLALQRRQFMALVSGAVGGSLLPSCGRANVPVPYSWQEAPPTESREAFIAWMRANRGEDPTFLGQRWDRYKALLAHNDLWGARNVRGFLLTPREDFLTTANLERP